MLLPCATQSVFEDFQVKSFLIAEMIIDRGDVGPGAGADFPDGGGAEAAFGKTSAAALSRSCRVAALACDSWAG